VSRHTLLFLIALCLVPFSLWAQSARLPMTLSTNSGTSGSNAIIKGYLGQPIVGLSGSHDEGYMMPMGHVRVLKQFFFQPTSGIGAPEVLPESFGLAQNYPNPFNPSTVIPFTLDKTGKGDMTIFNLLGQQVRSFDLSDLTPGLHHISWDGRAQNGTQLPSGQYFARLSHTSRVQVRKLTLLK
jgi:hypothetical protein